MSSGSEEGSMIQVASKPELIALLLAWLPPAAICRLGLTAKVLQQLAHEDAVWIALHRRCFHELPAIHHSYIKTFGLRAYHGQRLEHCHVQRCGGSLFRAECGRCTCVAARTKLPLTVGALHPTRSGLSALSSGSFRNFLLSLDEVFYIDRSDSHGQPFCEIKILTDASLAPLDLFILCTTEGPPLTADEIAALRRWVEAGGALIVSAFANWSSHSHYARETVGWLGIDSIPDSGFDAPARHNLIRDFAQGHVSELITGPFGNVDDFANQGESGFTLRQGCGGVKLTNCILTTLVYFPPDTYNATGATRETITGKGRVLVIGNYHCLVNPGHWHGNPAYQFVKGGHNESLVRNLIAGALASRSAVHHDLTM